MNYGWTEVRLGDVVDLLTGFPFQSREYTTAVDGIRLLRGDNIVQGGLRWADAKRWSPQKLEGVIPYSLSEGDVVLAMDRPWIEAGLKYAAMRSGDLPAFLVQRVARLRARKGLSQNFLKYVVGGRAFTEHVLAVQTGTAVPHISAGQIRNFSFWHPPMREQEAIAAILRTLDDKIELNRRTSETLEAMARALFKSWFVDFDPVHAKKAGRTPEGMAAQTAELFPDSFENPGAEREINLPGLPAGWSFTTVRAATNGLYDGPHATPPEASEGPIFLGIRNFRPTSLDFADVRHIAEGDYADWTRRVVPKPLDIVFTYEATLGFFALVPPSIRCCLGRRTALIRAKPQDGNTHFLFHWFISEPFQSFLRAHRQPGSTVDRIWLKDFPAYPVLVPPAAVVSRFEEVAASIWARLHVNQAQMRALTALRDALLPKLLSGELRVPEAERIVGKAV